MSDTGPASQADPPGRPLPGREQHDGVERSRRRAARSTSRRSCTWPEAAERGKFDFFFLAEGLRLREHRGRIFDLDVVGRPDSLTVLSGLAAVTDKIGLAATLNTTFNEPYELARQFATLDHLSKGRAAWNAVTSPDAFTGENFRRGGFLDPAERYERAAEFIATAKELWDSWEADPIVADHERRGVRAARSDRRVRPPRRRSSTSAAASTCRRSPQRYPVQIQAGDSDGGRELAARYADVIFSRHSGFEDGQAFYADVKGRLARYGRAPDDLKIIPAAVAVLGDSEADATRTGAARSIASRYRPRGPSRSSSRCGTGTCPAYDPDGPLPDRGPRRRRPRSPSPAAGSGTVKDPLAVARNGASWPTAKSLSIRELIIEVTARTPFVGTPGQVAEQINRHVQDDAADGYIFVPHLTPHGLDEFIDKVVPELQDRGVFRSRLRARHPSGHLDLAPLRPSVAAI